MASALVSAVTTAGFQSDVAGATTPVLVDFWAEWCGPCKMLAPLLDDVAKELEGKLKIVKVNVDSEPELAKQFGIQAIPTMIFFKGGQAVDQVVGMTSKKDLLARAAQLV
jgi:thioredoxin 1